MRAALETLPTWNLVAPGQDAYVGPQILARQLPHARRWWTFNGRISTVERDDATLVKSVRPFLGHPTLPEFNELIEESASVAGVHRPTGYADVFHKLYPSPYTTPSFNAALRARFAGGWQEAIRPGTHKGLWRRYDVRSAYLWAATEGMPDPRSYRPVGAIQRHPALYRVEIEYCPKGAPFPYNSTRDVLATDDEIELYSLPVKRVISGISWRTMLPPEPIIKAVQSVSYWKYPARMYWGRWAQMGAVECNSANGNAWPMRNPRANIVWAHLIVGRVRSLVWQQARGAVHVYVDSLITQSKLRTGACLGDWRLEEEYPDGVSIMGPGHYGHPHKPAQKWAGVAKGDPRRASPLTIE